jgi:hypothetical protein
MPERSERSDAGGIAEGLQRQTERFEAFSGVRARAQESGWDAMLAQGVRWQQPNAIHQSL